MTYRGLSLLVVVGLCAQSVAVMAGPSDYLKGLYSKARSASVEEELSPCATDFELQVSVIPVQGNEQDDASAKIGINFSYSPKGARGIASRIHTDAKVELSQKRCQLWEKKFWPLLSSILEDNRRAERGSLQCFNVGSVKYRIGGQETKADICLNDAKLDNVTYAFRYFYDGTDGLVAR